MSEQPGRAWTAMTPGDFDRDEPLRLNVRTGPAPVPAEPDACGTAALFGDTAPPPAARPPAPPRRRRGPAAPGQEPLF
ncbi:hypothetical protein ACFWNK_27095 [Streptomyces sp. NPDC058417]|uniref:hypothetical protein n=1 Tax=unclassified Streptomyces TaxID=2593676 RepID=UPI00366766DC